MDSPECGQVHVGTGMDSPARTACWPMASAACFVGESVSARDRQQDGQRDEQGENVMSPMQAMLHIARQGDAFIYRT